MNQHDAQPLFVVTAPANDDLFALLRREILPEIRRLVGERRVTMVFDREGWSPKFSGSCTRRASTFSPPAPAPTRRGRARSSRR